MRPPPLTRFIHFPVTAGTALLAIGITAAFMAGREIDPMLMNALAFEGQPWRLVTSILPHGGIVHLLFNVIWLWIFGTALESTWGAARTLAIFLFFAVVTSLAEYAVFDGGIGLSGVGYGLFGLLAVLSRRDARFAGAVDARTTRLFIAWFFLCIAFTVANVMRIGNVAHGVGGVIGALLGFALAGRGKGERIGGAVGVLVIAAASLLCATMWRPIVNRSATGGNDSAVIGYELLHVKKCGEALHHLERAVEMTPSDSGSWFNLGVCSEQLGHRDASLAAFKRAYDLDAKDPDYKDGYARALTNAAVALAKADDHAKAVELYKQALAIDPGDKVALYDLTLAYEKLKNYAAALEAARKLYATEQSVENHEHLAEVIDLVAATSPHEQAVTLYRESIAIHPTSYRYDRLANALKSLGRDAEAAEALAESQRLEGTK